MNIIEKLIERNLTISAAESLTGGLFQATLVSMEHASKVFLGGVVSYTKEAKCRLLGLTMEEIERFGVYSNETSFSMAQGVKKLTNSNIAIGISGVAGPGSDEGVEAGTVYYTIVLNEMVYNKKIEIKDETRQIVREKTVEVIINDLFELLK
jgi:PncC family amidohydrolase